MSASPLVDRWIVLKFGGTSVSRRHRWDTIGKLAKKRAEETGARVLVVVSALSGVTNELQAVCDGHADAAVGLGGQATAGDFLPGASAIGRAIEAAQQGSASPHYAPLPAQIHAHIEIMSQLGRAHPRTQKCQREKK